MREIGMSEEQYRDMLLEFGAKLKDGKPSASTLSIPALERVLSHLKSCGFRPRKAGTPVNFKQGQIAKCKKLWDLLFEAGVMRQPYSEASLTKYAFRMTGVNNIHWATSTGLAKTIEALKAMAKRERVNIEQQRDTSSN
jgi:hypothetical protein